jgi:N utilization substance protein B
MVRRKGREIALQLLYQIEVSRLAPELALETYRRYLNIEEEKAFAFGEELVKGVLAHKEHIDSYIQRYSPDWPLERMNFTDKNILRLAIYEFFYRPEIPPVVSINEAVELAKLYGTDESPAFVNGILDSIYKNELFPREKSLFK